LARLARLVTETLRGFLRAETCVASALQTLRPGCRGGI
jgi:hypothetical protein